MNTATAKIVAIVRTVPLPPEPVLCDCLMFWSSGSPCSAEKFSAE